MIPALMASTETPRSLVELRVQNESLGEEVQFWKGKFETIAQQFAKVQPVETSKAGDKTTTATVNNSDVHCDEVPPSTDIATLQSRLAAEENAKKEIISELERMRESHRLVEAERLQMERMLKDHRQRMYEPLGELKKKLEYLDERSRKVSEQKKQMQEQLSHAEAEIEIWQLKCADLEKKVGSLDIASPSVREKDKDKEREREKSEKTLLVRRIRTAQSVDGTDNVSPSQPPSHEEMLATKPILGELLRMEALENNVARLQAELATKESICVELRRAAEEEKQKQKRMEMEKEKEKEKEKGKEKEKEKKNDRQLDMKGYLQAKEECKKLQTQLFECEEKLIHASERQVREEKASKLLKEQVAELKGKMRELQLNYTNQKGLLDSLQKSNAHKVVVEDGRIRRLEKESRDWKARYELEMKDHAKSREELARAAAAKENKQRQSTPRSEPKYVVDERTKKWELRAKEYSDKYEKECEAHKKTKDDTTKALRIANTAAQRIAKEKERLELSSRTHRKESEKFMLLSAVHGNSEKYLRTEVQSLEEQLETETIAHVRVKKEMSELKIQHAALLSEVYKGAKQVTVPKLELTPGVFRPIKE